MSITLDTPIGKLKGIGDQREKNFKKIGIEKVEDLLYHFPRKYINLKKIKKICSLKENELVTVKGNVITSEWKNIQKNKGYLKVAVSDGTGILYVIFFNQFYLKEIFRQGKTFLFYGKVEIFNKEFEMINPFFEELGGEKLSWILPVYSLTKGLSQRYLRKLIKNILESIENYPSEILPIKRRISLGISNIKHALKNIHFPASEIDLEKARNYLIFREFFIMQLNLFWKKINEQKIKNEEKINTSGNIIDEFRKLLPFDLTQSQKEVMEEIIQDIKSGKLLRRLIYGEVGSGKTVIAIFCLWLFTKNGYQGVFLCPTEILAQQHFINWYSFFESQGIKIVLLTGGIELNDKIKSIEGIKNGKFKVIIGTHALLNEKLEFHNLKIIIVDEQHKFGVKQQEFLKKKSENIHYICMSATPIPRTIALTLYGNMDFSVLGEIPNKKRQIITYLFSVKEREKVYRFVNYLTSINKIGFVITPAIKENENIESVEKLYNEIKHKYGEINTDFLHGKMDKENQNRILQKFRNGEIKLLISTTVVETGIDIPSVNFIIIEQAEKFGLAQLHQLRGRIGRDGETGYCFLIVYSENEEINKRLIEFMEKESGFEIAELDLNLRGPGDLFGIRQHGIMPLKIGDIKKDFEWLKLARKEVERILKVDPELKKYINLREFLYERKDISISSST